MPSSLFKVGDNTVSLVFLNQYRKDGMGLHSYIDTTDNQQYLYTQCEVDYCHYIFPVFDQPSLKATWTLRAHCPADWLVVSNENSVEDDAAQNQ